MKDYYSFGNVMSSAWKVATKNWLVFIGLLIGFMIISGLIGAFSGVIFTVRYGIVTLVSAFFNAFFFSAYYKMYLNAAKGEEPDFSLFKSCAKYTFKFWVVSLILSVIYYFGVLCAFFTKGLIMINNPEFSNIFGDWKSTVSRKVYGML